MIFDRYVTSVECVVSELIAHCKEIVDPAAEHIEMLQHAEETLVSADCSDDESVQRTLQSLRADAASEASVAAVVYERYLDAMDRIEALIHDARYDVDEPSQA